MSKMTDPNSNPAMKQVLENAADDLLERDEVAGVLICTMDRDGNVRQYSIGKDGEMNDRMFSYSKWILEGLGSEDETVH